METTSIETVYWLVPEIILVCVAAGVMVAGAFAHRSRMLLGVTAIGFLVAAAALLSQLSQSRGAWPESDAVLTTSPHMSGPLVLDVLALGSRIVSLMLGFFLVLTMARAQSSRQFPELIGSVTLLTAGVMLVGTARDLVLLFVGFELISIPTYVLLYLGSRQRGAVEATAKYFFLSVFSSALLLFGFSLLYGISGSVDLADLSAAMRASAAGAGFLQPVALLLVFAGLGFKLTAVPFHFYAPDVYEATSPANAGLLSVIPKVAGLIGLVRLLIALAPGDGLLWKLMLVLSIATMTLGNVSALWQSNVRRLMAYSSIAHAGYLLIAVAVAMAVALAGGTVAAAATGAALYYLLGYAAATVGFFAALAHLEARGRWVDRVDQLAGVARHYPMIGAAMAVCLLSLTGIPPLAGFWGKFTLFASALEAALDREELTIWLVVLAVAGVINAAVGAAYYLRIVGVMYFVAPNPESREGAGAAEGGCGVGRPAHSAVAPDPESREGAGAAEGRWCTGWAAIALAGLTVAIGLVAGPLLSASRSAAGSALATGDRVGSTDVRVVGLDHNHAAIQTYGRPESVPSTDPVSVEATTDRLSRRLPAP